MSKVCGKVGIPIIMQALIKFYGGMDKYIKLTSFYSVAH
jgi:hypothetical protein